MKTKLIVGKFLSAEHALKGAVEKKKSPLTAITGGEEGDKSWKATSGYKIYTKGR